MKILLKKVLKFFGYEVHKVTHHVFSYEWVKNMNINSIIDVGANQGQFALDISQHFPNVVIYSFEPIKDIYNILIDKTKHLNIKTFNLGLGDKNEKLYINHTIYGNATSSILEMSENHKNNFPEFVNTKKEEINLITLDEFFQKNSLKKNIFLKIDVQGYEDKVLIGGENMLKHVKIVQMETTFMEMYKGEKLFDYYLTFMKNNGFELYGFTTLAYDRKLGQPSYADAFFVRADI